MHPCGYTATLAYWGRLEMVERHIVTADTDSLYLVATDDGSDPDYTTTREAGCRLAQEDGAAVLLYDRTSESMLTDPYPVGPWSPEEDAVSEDTELDTEMLENLGRHYLIEQIREAEQQGLQVRAHLARGAGDEAFTDAVDRFHPDLLVLPESMASPSLTDRVRGSSLAKIQESVGVPIRVVSSDGSVREL